MPRGLALAFLFLSGLALTSAALAGLGGSRYIVEDGATGVQTTTSAPTLIFGQDSTTLRAAVCDTGVCTRDAPVAGAREGLRIGNCASVGLQVCAPPGGALLGTGAVDVYYYDPDEDARTDAGYLLSPNFRRSVTSTARCQAFPLLAPYPGLNGTRAVFVADSVGVDGGSALADGGFALSVKSICYCQPGTTC